MFTEEEKLCLKWKDFQENAISAYGTLREDGEFADVTLACEDGQQMEAHKVILASSSPFFLNLLRRNKHSHPLIYMRGMKSEDLVAMIDFLYYGEANVYQENLDSFLTVAEELQLKGLMGSGGPKQKTQKLSQEINYLQQEIPPMDMDEPKFVAKIETSTALEGSVAVTDFAVAVDLQDLDDKIKSMIESTEKTMFASNQNRKVMKCKVCGKEDKLTNIRSHIESIHIIGVSHTCNICGTVARSRSALAVHRSSKHRAN